jgi:hypothetical protein
VEALCPSKRRDAADAADPGTARVPAVKDPTGPPSGRPSAMATIEHSARLLVVGLVIAVVVVWLFVIWTGKFGPFLGDVDAYWNAALRLRAGEALYPKFPHDTSADVFRYSPWFAYAWIPLTLLPRAAVDAAWFTTLMLASGYSIRHLLNREGGLVAGLLGTTLSMAVQAGNVHPLVIAVLIVTLGTRAAPLGIALAASLKAFPILFVLVFLGRREWRRAFETVALTALLVSPLAGHDLSNYTLDPERTLSLFAVNPVLWALIALGTAAAAIWLARSPFSWLAAGIAVIASLPRVILYDFSYLLVGTRSTTVVDWRGRQPPST